MFVSHIHLNRGDNKKSVQVMTLWLSFLWSAHWI